MTILAVNLDAAKLSPRSSRRSPSRRSPSKISSRNSTRSSLPKAASAKVFLPVVRDENNANHSEPLQFEFSPAPLRMQPLFSPAPTHNESDSESLGSSFSSRSSRSSSEVSSLESTQDDVIAQITAGPLPIHVGGAPALPQARGSRRGLSKSANLFFAVKSQIDQVEEETPVKKKGSPVKKNLFSAISEDDDNVEEDEQQQDVLPFRWERSASMVELSVGFAMPAPAANVMLPPVARFV
jgi:hypothetical protein